MSKPNDGGPAFAQTDCALPPNVPYSGMSLRAWFAGMALNVAPRITREDVESCGTELCVKASAQWAARIADALIAELERETK